MSIFNVPELSIVQESFWSILCTDTISYVLNWSVLPFIISLCLCFKIWICWVPYSASIKFFFSFGSFHFAMLLSSCCSETQSVHIACEILGNEQVFTIVFPLDYRLVLFFVLTLSSSFHSKDRLAVFNLWIWCKHIVIFVSSIYNLCWCFWCVIWSSRGHALWTAYKLDNLCQQGTWSSNWLIAFLYYFFPFSHVTLLFPTLRWQLY